MYKIELIDNVTDLWSLQQQWDHLWSRSEERFGLSYAVARSAWVNILEPSGAKPIAVAAFRGDVLAGIWAGAVRRRGLWRVLQPMVPLAAEISDLLVEPQAPPFVAAEMLTAIAKARRADIASLPCTKAGGLLESTLTANGRIGSAAPDVAPFVAWREGESWQSYYASLSGHYRKLQRQKKKRLEQLGPLTTEIVRDQAAYAQLVGWILGQKRIWAERTGKQGPWLYSDRYETFLTDLPKHQGTRQNFAVFTLRSSGEVVAAMLVMIGTTCLDMMILGFDVEFSASSPGLLLSEICLEFACRHNLKVELGVGVEGNKRVWSRGEAMAVTSYKAPLSPWGRLGCEGLAAARGLRDHSIVKALRRPKAVVAGQQAG